MNENQTGLCGSLRLDCINKQEGSVEAVSGNGKDRPAQLGRFTSIGDTRNSLEALRLRYKNAGKFAEAKAIARAIQVLRRGAE